MSRKKILYLGNVLSAHGFNPTTIETLSERLAADFEITLSSSQRNKLLRLLDMWWHILMLRKQIDFVMIDTYSSAAFLYAWSSGLLCKGLKLPYIAFLHGGDLPNRFEKSKAVSRRFITNAKAVVTPSGYLEDAVKSHFGTTAVIIPNYLDFDNYPFLLREKIDEVSILWVRSFHVSYQPELAIRMIAMLKERGLIARLTMVGPNKDGSLETCEKLANELGVSESIQFTGRLPKEEWLKRSSNFSVFLNTTSIDNTPVSVMEAMALGMPVVTTKVGGIPFLFEDGKEGIMVEEQSATALAEAILSLVNNPAKTQSISTFARKKSEEWNWELVRKQWLETLEAIKK